MDKNLIAVNKAAENLPQVLAGDEDFQAALQERDAASEKFARLRQAVPDHNQQVAELQARARELEAKIDSAIEAGEDPAEMQESIALIGLRINSLKDTITRLEKEIIPKAKTGLDEAHKQLAKQACIIMIREERSLHSNFKQMLDDLYDSATAWSKGKSAAAREFKLIGNYRPHGIYLGELNGNLWRSFRPIMGDGIPPHTF